MIQHGLLTAVGSGLLASVVCPLTFDIFGLLFVASVVTEYIVFCPSCILDVFLFLLFL